MQLGRYHLLKQRFQAACKGVFFAVAGDVVDKKQRERFDTPAAAGEQFGFQIKMFFYCLPYHFVAPRVAVGIRADAAAAVEFHAVAQHQRGFVHLRHKQIFDCAVDGFQAAFFAQAVGFTARFEHCLAAVQISQRNACAVVAVGLFSEHADAFDQIVVKRVHSR